jgi:hypothetical protein
MLPAPSDPCPPDDLAVPSPAPAPSRAQSLALPGFRPVALAGAIPLPGLEPWTCFGRQA